MRRWRLARGRSQMWLALEAGVSTRHMSFVETGRARPSRDLLVRIADRLGVPAREQNELLERAGYARRFRESSLDDPDLEHVRRVLAFLLERHEPHGALVFDAHWDIVMSNAAHRRAVAYFVGEPGPETDVLGNLLRLTFHPRGLRPRIANWGVVASTLLSRLERELDEAPSDRRLAALVEEVRGYGPVPPPDPAAATSHAVLLPVHLRKDDVEVRLFSVLSTVGSAIDIGVQALRLETFFPADEPSAEALAALA